MADPKAIQFLEGIYARVDKQVRDIITSMLPNMTIAAQDDGSVVANDHRILNFQGPGVAVSDEPGLRRVNVYVPGAPVDTTSGTFSSGAGLGKFLEIGVGGTPPTNWYQPSYSDTAWTASVASSHDYSGWVSPSATTWIASTTASTWADNFEVLHRRTFTLGTGTIAGATFVLNVDNRIIEFYMNGTAISGLGDGSPTAMRTLSISPSVLLPGATNLIALRIKNLAN